MSALENEILEKLAVLGSKRAKLLFLDELRQKVEQQSESSMTNVYDGVEFPGALTNEEWDRQAAALREAIRSEQNQESSITIQDILDEIREEASWRGLSS